MHPAFGTFVARRPGAARRGARISDRACGITRGRRRRRHARVVRSWVRSDAVRYTAVEISAGARAALARRRRGRRSPSALRAAGRPRARARAARQPARSGWCATGDEVAIGSGGRRARRTDAPDRRRALADTLDGVDTTARPRRARRGRSPSSIELAASLAARLRAPDRLRRRRPRAAGARLPRPPASSRTCSSAPGTADITAGVDFGWLARHARRPRPPRLPQLRARATRCSRSGSRTWLPRRARAPAGAPRRAAQGLEAVRTWSARSRASLLVDPGALGRMRWLLLATAGSSRAGVAAGGAGTEGPIDLRRSTHGYGRAALRTPGGIREDVAVTADRCCSSLVLASIVAVLDSAASTLVRHRRERRRRPTPADEPGSKRAAADPRRRPSRPRSTAGAARGARPRLEPSGTARRSDRARCRSTRRRAGRASTSSTRKADDWEPAIAADPTRARTSTSSRPATRAEALPGQLPVPVDGAVDLEGRRRDLGQRNARCARARAPGSSTR